MLYLAEPKYNTLQKRYEKSLLSYVFYITPNISIHSVGMPTAHLSNLHFGETFLSPMKCVHYITIDKKHCPCIRKLNPDIAKENGKMHIERIILFTAYIVLKLPTSEKLSGGCRGNPLLGRKPLPLCTHQLRTSER